MGNYVGDIVKLVREKTGNVEVSIDTTDGTVLEGISEQLILSYMNEALRFIQSRIIAVYPGAFVEEEIISLVMNQEAYSISDNVFLNNKLVSVEFSEDGRIDNYINLPPFGMPQRRTYTGIPQWYIRRNGQILVNPIANRTGMKIRVNYYRTIDKLDVRRASIDTINPTNWEVTLVDSERDQNPLENAQYVCTVDALGVVKDYNVQGTYDNNAGTFTVNTTGLTAEVGDFLVIGKYATSHLQDDVPERVEDYLRTYAQERVLNTDSSQDEINEKQIVKDILADIVDAFSEISEDVNNVPLLDEGLR